MSCNLGTFSMLIHNGNLINEAEKMINSYLSIESNNHKVGLWLENPDGTRVAVKPGFKLHSYEYILDKLEDDL